MLRALSRSISPAVLSQVLGAQQIISGVVSAHTLQQLPLIGTLHHLCSNNNNYSSSSSSYSTSSKQRKQQQHKQKQQAKSSSATQPADEQQAKQSSTSSSTTQPADEQQRKSPLKQLHEAASQHDIEAHAKQLEETVKKLQQQLKGQGTANGEEQTLEGPNGTLAEWRVESAAWWAQMFHHAVDANLAHPQGSTWSQLYRPQSSRSLAGFLLRLLVPEGSSNLTWPLSSMYSRHQLIAEFLLTHAHADFDSEGFKQGAKQALEYSTSLYAGSDWVSLKPLVSESLLQSMRHARQQQAEAMDADDATVSDVELVIDADSVRLVSASAITRDQLAALDQQRARDSLPLIPVAADDEESATVDTDASAASSAAHSATAAPVAEGAADAVVWDVAHVYAEGVLHTQVSRGGEAAQAVELSKRGHYLLCRGPVHLDRVLSAEAAEHTPWFLLAWL